MVCFSDSKQHSSSPISLQHGRDGSLCSGPSFFTSRALLWRRWDSASPVMAMMGFLCKGGGEAVDSPASGCCLRCIASGEREIVEMMEVRAWRCP
ncbi:hypothetical protein AAC387_Pa03g0236 [Persea americana]